MLQLRDGISSIYSDSPKGVYFLTGPDYGIKCEYIEHLREFYNNNYVEYSSIEELIQSFNKKSLIPKPPTLYLVRYDKSFLSGLNKDKAKTLKDCNISGTLVALYDDDKDEFKLDKYFSDNVLRINYLTKEVLRKHLLKAYPNLTDTVLNSVMLLSDDFYKCKLICYAINLLPESKRNALTSSEILRLFNNQSSYDTSKFKIGVASRNVNLMISEVENYTDDFSNLYYDILSTLIELTKVFERKYSDSYAAPYVKLWSPSEVRAMFNIAYSQLDMLRSNSSYDKYVSIMYICMLLRFRVS